MMPFVNDNSFALEDGVASVKLIAYHFLHGKAGVTRPPMQKGLW
jgi:hypothetical protein